MWWSGFLEYRKLDGSWRPFLFQTVDFQLVLYRVHVGFVDGGMPVGRQMRADGGFWIEKATHQVTVMSTDIRSATEIALIHEGASESVA